MDLYKALRFLHRSSSDVKPDTIANCFREAGFIKNIEPVEPSLEDQIDAEVRAMEEVQQPDEGDEELSILWAELQRVNLVEGTLDEYLAVDDQLALEIAADVSKMEMEEPESDTDVMEIGEEPALPVTSREAKEDLEVLQRYAETTNPVLQQHATRWMTFWPKTACVN